MLNTSITASNTQLHVSGPITNVEIHTHTKVKSKNDAHVFVKVSLNTYKEYLITTNVKLHITVWSMAVLVGELMGNGSE